MNTQHLRYVLEIEKTGSISAAAANLYMSQPNLSKALRELELALGLVIFQRSSKGVQPTTKGREFLARARAVIEQVEAMEALGHPESAQLGFQISVPPCAYLALAFARFVQHLSTDKPLDICFRETSSVEVVEQVGSGVCRIGVVRCTVGALDGARRRLAAAGLETRLLWRFHQRLLFSAAHPLAEKDRISSGELAVYTCLDDDEMLRFPGSVAASGEKSASRILVMERESQYRLLQRLPECYMWGTPAPQDMLDDYQLMQRRCNEAAPHCADLLIYRQGYELTALDEAFIQEVNAVCEELE